MKKITSADLTRARDPDLVEFEDGWCGMEMTFQDKKSIKLYSKYEWQPGGEDVYFNHKHMVGTVRDCVSLMEKRWRKAKKKGAAWACFDDVEVGEKLDPWKVLRAELEFTFDRGKHDFEVKFGMDPSTFEYGIKPIPLKWLYNPAFVEFLERLTFGVPADLGLTPSLLNGGGQFHLSAKSYLTGSLLADDIATRLNHPELATWMMDWPNCDDRSLRATAERTAAYESQLEQYWRGCFHPKATGVLTVEHAYFDRFTPSQAPPRGLMGDKGPTGGARDVFQTNFHFGRSVRLRAQAIHPGYWQLAHYDDDGFRPDQIMRYSEGNLNRLQIAGEHHVKSGVVLDHDRVPELNAPLERTMLIDEAAWEQRGQQSRVSARDTIEAILLDVHHALWLKKHPRVKVKASLLQDQLLKDAEHTLKKHGGQKALDKLERAARKYNAEASKGRIKSDFIEPEALFWAAWAVLPQRAKVALAEEAMLGFIERVHEAAAADPRGLPGDPMDAHRHRPHPLLYATLAGQRGVNGAVEREVRLFEENKKKLLALRPVFSQVGDKAPWPEA